MNPENFPEEYRPFITALLLTGYARRPIRRREYARKQVRLPLAALDAFFAGQLPVDEPQRSKYVAAQEAARTAFRAGTLPAPVVKIAVGRSSIGLCRDSGDPTLAAARAAQVSEVTCLVLLDDPSCLPPRRTPSRFVYFNG